MSFKPKLYFFDFNGGTADAIRVALKIGGVDFEDVRLDWAGAAEFHKKAQGLEQLPVLEVSAGKYIGQSLAILRYAGRLAKLYPEDPLAAAEVDEVLYSIEEIQQPLSMSNSLEGDAFVNARRKVNNETTPWVAKDLERRIQANGSGYLVGSSLTIADVQFTVYMEFVFQSGFFDHLRNDALAPYNGLTALMQRVNALPAVVEYRKAFPRHIVNKLYYYDSIGRAEPTRLAFAIGGIGFKDVRLKADDFNGLELPIGTVPMLEITNFSGVRKVCESDAILRYVGKLAGLYPSAPLDALLVDEVLQIAEELWTGNGGLSGFFAAADADKPAVLQKWGTTNAPVMFKALETKAEKNKESGWMVGSEVTTADVTIAVLIEALRKGPLAAAVGSFVPPTPALDAVAAKVYANPKVVAYYAANPKQ
jgi:glutathione S-transferase